VGSSRHRSKCHDPCLTYHHRPGVQQAVLQHPPEGSPFGMGGVDMHRGAAMASFADAVLGYRGPVTGETCLCLVG
jgi:hypothetical protein